MIALFGGTFDPIHVGHVAAALAAIEMLRVERMHLVVAAQPYHKAGDREVSAAEHRLAMVDLACQADERLLADGSELDHQGASYTVQLLERRKSANPRERRIWVIGADAFRDVQSWYRWQDVFGLTNFLVFPRQGQASGLPEPLMAYLAPRLVTRIDGRRHGQVLLCERALPEVSSSEIRARIAAREAVEHLLPRGVYPYIKRHQLYEGRVATAE